MKRQTDGDSMRQHVSNVKGSTDGRSAQSAVPATSTRRQRKPRMQAVAYLTLDDIQPREGYVIHAVHTTKKGNITRVDWRRA